MKSGMIALLVLASATAAPVLAEKTDSTAPAASADTTDKGSTAAAPKEKMICRSERVTGSRVKVNRTCMTQAQWDELADRTRKDLGDFSRDSSRAGAAKGPFG